MALKYKTVEAQAAAEAEFKGPWGEIVHSEQRYIHFVRYVHGIEERWSYPYQALMRRIFRKSEPEEIEILACGDTITIRGHGLEKFLAPLEKRCLVRVEQQTIRFAALEPNSCSVTEIRIESSHGD
jgi:hypothetical protein